MTTVLERPRPACAGLTAAELEWFCPDDDLPAAVRAEMVENARGVCAGCPIVSRCLSGALAAGDVHTVRAGLTPEERAALRPAFLRVRIVAPRHGNRAAYIRGCRCRPCTDSHARYMSEWRARRQVQFVLGVPRVTNALLADKCHNETGPESAGNAIEALTHPATDRRAPMSLPTEQWKPIPGFEGVYAVSDLGRVRTWHRGGRLLSPSTSWFGYPRVTLYLDGERYYRTIHSLVAAAFIGPRPTDMQVRHLDGNPANNARVNLAYGTASENEQDKLRHGNHREASKTHCIRNHAFDEANTRVNPDGSRSCRKCCAVLQARHREERGRTCLDPSACPVCHNPMTRGYVLRHLREVHHLSRQVASAIHRSARIATQMAATR